MIPENVMNQPSWYESSARARIEGLLDAGSFKEILGPQDQVMSPHLALFDLPPAFDDGMIIGRGLIDGRPVAIAAQEGQFMGGTFAEVSGAKLVGLLRAVARNAGTPQEVSTVFLLLDTGGVRLQEANAGEMAVSETIHAILDVRHAGVTVDCVSPIRSAANVKLFCSATARKLSSRLVSIMISLLQYPLTNLSIIYYSTKCFCKRSVCAAGCNVEQGRMNDGLDKTKS